MRVEVVLRGGAVIYGTGAPAFRADVGVRGGRIVAVADLGSASADVVFDVAGLTVVPGFIDTHTHSDLAPFLPPSAADVQLASVRQGVTTEVCGNCGFSPFPTLPEWSSDVDHHMQALFGPGARTYHSLAEFQEALAAVPLVNNIAPLVGHGTIRAGIMGFAQRAATAAEIAHMEQALDRAFRQGAFGLSSGLIYPPGVYAATEELVALAKIAARHDRPYTTHMRNETDGVQNAVDEALHIGQAADVAVHISHLKTAGRANWGRSTAILASLDRARQAGIDVTADLYPYTAGSTLLHALLPPWVNEGGIDSMLERLKDPAIRVRIAHDYATGLPGWQDLVAASGWDSIVIATAPRNRHYEGRRIADLAGERGQSPVEFVCALLLDERATVTIVLHMMDEADVRTIMRWPLAMIGSDGIPLPGKPHPRWAGTFARVLGRYTREQQVLTLPEAIYKMTALSANRFRLHDRGRIAVGQIADLVVLDAARVIDGATYEEPLIPPLGIVHVLVAGAAVIRDGQDTGVRNGQLLQCSSGAHSG